ncbi:MAG: hypothetical protein ACM3X4_10700 [Ignavibacteriales bacterium]
MAAFVSRIILQINQLRATSLVSQGQTTANAWSFLGKDNVVVGEISGNLNVVPVCVAVLNDCDVSDLFFPNQGFDSPAIGPIAEGL